MKWLSSPRLPFSRKRMAEPSGAVAWGSGGREALCIGSVRRLHVITGMVGDEGRGRVHHVVQGNDVLGARGAAAADYPGAHVEPVLAEVGEAERAVTGQQVATLVDAATYGGHGVVPDICLCTDDPIEGFIQGHEANRYALGAGAH